MKKLYYFLVAYFSVIFSVYADAPADLSGVSLQVLGYVIAAANAGACILATFYGVKMILCIFRGVAFTWGSKKYDEYD